MMKLFVMGSTLKERICFYRTDPTDKGGKRSRVASLVHIPIHLNTVYLSYLAVALNNAPSP